MNWSYNGAMGRSFAVASVVVACACTQALASDWPTYMGNNERTGYNPVHIDPSRLSQIWRSGARFHSPRIVGDRIVAVGRFGTATRLASLDARTGAVLWSQPAPTGFAGVHAVFDNYVAWAGGGQGRTRLTIYRLDTGQIVGSVGNLDIMLTSPMIRKTGEDQYDITMPLTNHVGCFRFNGSSVTTSWYVINEAGISTAPSLIGNSAIFALGSRAIAFDISTGQANVFLNESGIAQPAVALIDRKREIIILRSASPTPELDGIAAYRYISQDQITPLWRRSGIVPGGHMSQTSGGDVILFDNGRLMRLDTETGATVAMSAPIDAVEQPVFLSQGLAWLGTASGFQAFDLSTLQSVATLTGTPGFGRPNDSAMVVASDKYLVTQNGLEGFTVYLVPEPSVGVAVLAGLALLRRHKRK